MYWGVITVGGSLFPGVPEKPTDTSQIALSGEGKRKGTDDPTTLVSFVPIHIGLMTSSSSSKMFPVCFIMELSNVRGPGPS